MINDLFGLRVFRIEDIKYFLEHYGGGIDLAFQRIDLLLPQKLKAMMLAQADCWRL